MKIRNYNDQYQQSHTLYKKWSTNGKITLSIPGWTSITTFKFNSDFCQNVRAVNGYGKVDTHDRGSAILRFTK